MAANTNNKIEKLILDNSSFSLFQNLQVNITVGSVQTIFH
jgi:hypothetical protein